MVLERVITMTTLLLLVCTIHHIIYLVDNSMNLKFVFDDILIHYAQTKIYSINIS